MGNQDVSNPRLVTSERLLEGAVLKLTLDSPPGNVLDTPMIRKLLEVLSKPLPEETRLILFEGAGKHFSFGASVPEHVKERVGAMLPTFHGLFERLAELSVPTAALVRGQCLGGGLELAAACDYLFVEESAKLAVPEIKLGVFPPMASLILPWRIGGGRATELVTTGRTLSAREAVDWGLGTALFESGTGLERVLDWTREHLLPLSASSLRYAVWAVRWHLERNVLKELPALERVYVTQLMETHDANEGIASFLEKRAPVWKHS